MLNPGVWVLLAVVCPTAAVRPNQALLLSDALMEDLESAKEGDEQVEPEDFDSLEEMPETCSNGTLTLEKRTYKVTEWKEMGDCNVTSHGARLLLQEEIVFNNVTFFGHLSVRGVAVLNKACVKMQSGTVVAGATLRVENCTNGNVWSSGGGVCARSLRVDGDLEIHQSHARCGGGVYVDDLDLGGMMKITRCSANDYGGALYATQLTQSGGTLTIRDSEAAVDGGALYILHSITQSGGVMTISHSKAKYNGGAIHVRGGDFTQSSSVLTISNSKAKNAGGAIWILRGSFTQSNSALTIRDSEAEAEGGGAIYVAEGNFTQLSGVLTISNSTAKQTGGAIYIRDGAFLMSGGELSLINCKAQRGGGLVTTYASVRDGQLACSECSSSEGGGCLSVSGGLDLRNTSVAFFNSTTRVLSVQHLSQVGGSVTVDTCAASTEILEASRWEITAGDVGIHHSTSLKTALVVANSTRLTSTTVVVSDSEGAAGVWLSNEAFIRDVKLNSVKSATPQIRAAAVDATNLTITGSEAWVSSSNVTFENIDCDQEFGGIFDEEGVQCKTCGAGFVFRKDGKEATLSNRSSQQECVKCPNKAQSCKGSRIEMQRGVMLDSDISRAFICPNSLACPGGVLSDLKSEQNRPMCAKGYEGLGCNTCVDDYARADSNPFVCLKCAKETWRKLMHAAIFLAGDVGVFGVSAAGVINAQGRNKNSAVYTNQLMSFSAVAGPVSLALQQTNTFRDKLGKYLWALVTMGSLPVKAGDAGDNSMAVSAECLLTYMGLEPSLYASHLLSSCVYLALGLLLAAVSGRGVAVVVTVNCFLAKFCSAFGRYLICYRMEPNGEHYCILEDSYLISGQVAAFVAIMLCFVVGPGAWLRMTRDKTRKEEPNVLYLTRSYKEGYEHWEVERLLRKMVLKLASATFPITLNPTFQMLSINIVLVASLALHLLHRPYLKAQWNNMEAGLLTAALCIVALTTAMVANEIHWACSDPVQFSLIFTISGIISIAGGLSTILLFYELYKENFGVQAHDPSVAEQSDGEQKS